MLSSEDQSLDLQQIKGSYKNLSRGYRKTLKALKEASSFFLPGKRAVEATDQSTFNGSTAEGDITLSGAHVVASPITLEAGKKVYGKPGNRVVSTAVVS